MKFSALGAEDNDGDMWTVGALDRQGRPRCQDGAVPNSWVINVLVNHGIRLFKFDYRIDASQSVTYADFLKLVEDRIGMKPLSIGYKDGETGRVRSFEGDSENGSLDDTFYNVVCMAMKTGHLETFVDSCETFDSSTCDGHRRGTALADNLHPLAGLVIPLNRMASGAGQDHVSQSCAVPQGAQLPKTFSSARPLPQRNFYTWNRKGKEDGLDPYHVELQNLLRPAADGVRRTRPVSVDMWPDPCDETNNVASAAEKQQSTSVSDADCAEGYDYGYSYGYGYSRHCHDKKFHGNLDYKMQVEALTDLVKKVDRGVDALLQGHASSLPFSAVQNQLGTVQELLQQLVDVKLATSENQRQTSMDAVQSSQTQVDKNDAYALSTKMLSEQNVASAKEDGQLSQANFELYNKDSVVHKDIQCNLCHRHIVGIRYMCGNCVDFDLCAACEDSTDCHFPDHVFIKIRKPIAKMDVKKKHGKLVPLLKHTLYEEGSVCVNRLGKPGDVSVGVLLDNFHELLKPIKSIMDAEFIEDETVPDGTKFHPGQCFTKSWRIINSGCRPWNEDTSLKFLWGTKGFVPNLLEVVVPPLLPKQRGKICVDYVSPDKTGFYESHWNFVHKGHLFGHRIWCSIEVIDHDNGKAKEGFNEIGSVLMEIQEPENGEIAHVKASSENAECPLKMATDKDNSIIGSHLQEGQKTKFLSQTATPNNTPFVLSPPKSPEPFDIEEEIVMRSFHDAEDMLTKEDNLMTIDSEFTSVASACSSDSDGEFVVVPMPSCFVFDPSQVITDAQRDSRSSSDSSLMFIRSDGEEIQPDGLPKMDFVLHGDHDYSKPTASSAASCDHLPEIRNGAVASVSGSSSGSSCKTASVKSSASTPPANFEISVTGGGALIKLTDPSSGEPTDEIPVARDISSSAETAAAAEDDDQALNSSSDNATAFRDPAASEESTNSGDSARMVNVLPEGLVSAAATIFNSARSAFEALQRVPSPPLGNRSDLLEPTSMRGVRSEPAPIPTSPANIVPLLREMGFHDTVTNDRLTAKHSGDLEKILDELFRLEDKDWFNHRH